MVSLAATILFTKNHPKDLLPRRPTNDTNEPLPPIDAIEAHASYGANVNFPLKRKCNKISNRMLMEVMVATVDMVELKVSVSLMPGRSDTFLNTVSHSSV